MYVYIKVRTMSNEADEKSIEHDKYMLQHSVDRTKTLVDPAHGKREMGDGGEGITWACAVSMRRRASGRKRARRESTICLAAPPAPASWGEEAEACCVGGSGGG